MALNFLNNGYFAGKVGIGTESPLKTLSVNGGDIAVNNGNGFIVGAAITGNTEIGRLSASSGQLQILTESTRDIKFGSTAYGNIMFLEGTNGNVGIGTTSPGYKLHVNGGGLQTTTLTGNKISYYDGNGIGAYSSTGWNIGNYVGDLSLTNNADDKDIIFKTSAGTAAAAEIMRIDGSSGNVGIGTTSPAYKLSVAGTFQVKDANSAVVIQEYSSGATIWMDGVDGDFVGGDYFNISAYGATDLAFGHGATTKMTLKNTGNLGIGTTSPNAKLEVDLGADGIISQFVGAGSDTLNITGQNNEILLDTRNASNGLAFGIQGSTKMVLKNSGNVGIGTTSPGYPLEVSGIIKTSTSFLGTTAIIQKVTALNTNGIQFTNNGGSEKMRITDTGNVGINKTNPGAKLDIQPTTADRKVTRIQNDVMSTYYYNSQVDAILAWTCGSYYQAEVVITANQTNGGAYNNIYIRGIWSNNHTSHHWDELERVGYLTGSTFTVSVGQNGATTASGRLELDFDYVSQSFSEMNIRVTDFYGSHTYTIT